MRINSYLLRIFIHLHHTQTSGSRLIHQNDASVWRKPRRLSECTRESFLIRPAGELNGTQWKGEQRKPPSAGIVRSQNDDCHCTGCTHLIIFRVVNKQWFTRFLYAPSTWITDRTSDALDVLTKCWRVLRRWPCNQFEQREPWKPGGISQGSQPSARWSFSPFGPVSCNSCDPLKAILKGGARNMAAYCKGTGLLSRLEEMPRKELA
jgi:hypothetical protein